MSSREIVSSGQAEHTIMLGSKLVTRSVFLPIMKYSAVTVQTTNTVVLVRVLVN